MLLTKQKIPVISLHFAFDASASLRYPSANTCHAEPRVAQHGLIRQLIYLEP